MHATTFHWQVSIFTGVKKKRGGTSHNKFTVWGRNRWGTIVGAYPDASDYPHGFKRYSDGRAIAIQYPGAAETRATAINDNGTIVGSYSKSLPPNACWHGFIYNNGKRATLDFPSQQTLLTGISSGNLIVGTTVQGRSSNTSTGAFMYQ